MKETYLQRLGKLITDELFNEVMGTEVKGVYLDRYEGKAPHIVYGKEDEISVDSFCFECIEYISQLEFEVDFTFCMALVQDKQIPYHESTTQESILKATNWVRDNK